VRTVEYPVSCGVAVSVGKTVTYPNTRGIAFPKRVSATEGGNWLSPSDHNDPDGRWTNEVKAYDGVVTPGSAKQLQSGYYLELTCPALGESDIKSDRIRVSAMFKSGSIWRTAENVVIDYWDTVGAAWTNFFDGTIDETTSSNREYQVIYLPSFIMQLEKLRIMCSDIAPGFQLALFEIQAMEWGVVDDWGPVVPRVEWNEEGHKVEVN